MLCVIKVEVVNVRGDTYTLAGVRNRDDLLRAMTYDSYREWADRLDIDVDFAIEAVKGRGFYNVSGEKVLIGMSEQAQIALGLPFEVFQNQDTMIKQLIKESSGAKNIIDRLRYDLGDYMNMKFIDRLKFLFTGKFIPASKRNLSA
jgi:hypothetical protein